MTRLSPTFDWQAGLVLLTISTNHFMQRPLRDAMATFCGAGNINWLMSGTLVGALSLSAGLFYLEKKLNITTVIPYLLTIMAFVQLVIYQSLQHPTFFNAMVYFVLNGATSLSLLSLVFKRVIFPYANYSKQVLKSYTISNAGAIMGPLITLAVAHTFNELTICCFHHFC
ncbi:MAG: hypothetical protein HC806_06370 [Anaerolineae bacterium]|nr:hypothetical protein [Anaerolineae bacterium]